MKLHLSWLFSSDVHVDIIETQFGYLKKPKGIDLSISIPGSIKIREKYIKEDIIGSGTYGTVFRAREKSTGHIYAIKRIIIDNFDDGIPASSMREIGILIELDQFKHPNIVGIHEFIHKARDISIVFEFVDIDLKMYMESIRKDTLKSKCLKSKSGLPIAFVKSFTRQLLDALRFCHQYHIIHRDIKPSNLLLTKKGVLKLADFGLARTNSVANRTYCHEIVTLWYRAPEVMLGATFYGTAIDIWSAGCIAYEMAVGSVLFAGDSEIDQLFQVFRKFGTPTEKEWPGVTTFADFNKEFPRFEKNGLTLRQLPKDLPEFLMEMLQLNPNNRAEAHELRHAKFLRGVKIMPI